jgi:hypothetical protein
MSGVVSRVDLVVSEEADDEAHQREEEAIERTAAPRRLFARRG